MSTEMVVKFSEAYAGTDIDPNTVKNVYGQWVEIKLQSAGGLPEAMRTDVVSRLVRDRCHELANAPASDKPAELDADRIWTELWPLDQRSEHRAQDVHNGKAVAATDHDAALADKKQLEELETRVRALPAGLRPQFADTISEATLDIGYALTGGSGPSSLRLARSQR